jgi:import inner membrane translocase subunit TIM21
MDTFFTLYTHSQLYVFIPSFDTYQYKDEQDGSSRTRVRYNLEGRHGAAFVFAEVSSAMPSGEFVYVLVQDKATGRVQTLIDNRAALTAARLSGGNAEAASAMSQLLRGSGGK